MTSPGLRPVLFLVSAASSYRLQKYVAEQLAAQGRPVVFVYEGQDDQAFRMISAEAASCGGEAIAFEATVDLASRSGPVWHRHPRPSNGKAIWRQAMRALAARRVRSVAGRLIPGVAPGGSTLRLEELRALLAARLGAARRIFDRVQPAVMVSCEDGVAALLPMHTAARAANVPVVVIPYGNAVQRDLEIALDAKAARGELIRAEGAWSALLKSHAPQWIKQGEHAGALMFPEEYIVASESLGMTLRDAWTVHGGYADRLCVESEQMRRLYLGEGLPESKLVATGTPYCDILLRALDRNPAALSALRQPRRIEPDVTRILVSWPPSYHASRAGFSEFASYRDMSVAVLGWLARLPNTVLTVSLHPATPAADRSAVLEAGVVPSEHYVLESIGQHDLFITYFSSTIRWAIAAGKPVINFDLYGVNLAAYDDAPGVRTVRAFSEFQRVASELTSSTAAFAHAAEQQIAVAPQWGTLDGQNTARVAAAILAA